MADDMRIDKIRVLLLSFVPLELEGAGTSRLLNYLLDFLLKKPAIEQLTVCTLGSVEKKILSNRYCYLTFKGFRLKFLQDISPSMIRYVLQYVLRNIERHRLRVLIVGSSLTCIFIALLLRLFFPEVRIVQIPQLHKDFIFRDKIAKFLYKIKRWVFIYLINFKIIQPTLIVYSREEENIVAPFAQNIIRRPLGIDLEKYTKIKKELNIKTHDEKLTLLHIGEIHRNKFPIFALEVMKTLKELTNNRVRLIAVGRIHKGYYRKLKEKIKSYGLEDIIQFTGLVSEDKLLEYWRRADIFVVFSASEAGPFVVLEAMAHGIPVVATRVGIVPELEACGMLLAANYGDVSEMVNKIIKLWEDGKFRSSLIRKATEQLPNYDIKYFLEVVYHTLIK